MTRLLIERVTHWVRARSLEEFGEVRRVKLVFSERGGLSYSQDTPSPKPQALPCRESPAA